MHELTQLEQEHTLVATIIGQNMVGLKAQLKWPFLASENRGN